MTLHIVTVVFQDDAQLSATYDSCDLSGQLDTRHWIFIKRHDESLPAKYPRATLLASQDSGIYNAMNLAFDHLRERVADQDVVVFMNAGDRFIDSELVSHLAAHAASQPDLSVAGVRLTRKGATVGQRPAPRPPTDAGAVLYRDYPCHQATFYSARFLRDIWTRRGYLYREDLRSCADLELYLAACERRLLTTPFITACYDVAGFSSTQSKAIAVEKSTLLREYGGNIRWRLYARLWHLRARLVEPKRRVLRAIGGAS
jgi:glycosyltransferase involved in cell wall biosynthesis